MIILDRYNFENGLKRSWWLYILPNGHIKSYGITSSFTCRSFPGHVCLQCQIVPLCCQIYMYFTYVGLECHSIIKLPFSWNGHGRANTWLAGKRANSLIFSFILAKCGIHSVKSSAWISTFTAGSSTEHWTNNEQEP